MLHFLALLDDALIERVFQPLSDHIAHYCGLSRFRAAAICLELAAVNLVLSQAPDLSDAVLGWQAGAAFAHVAFLLLGLTALLALRTLFQRIGSRPGNPLRLIMRPHRAMLLLLLAARLLGPHEAGIVDVADLAMLTLATLALYLGACAARPPMRRAFGLPQAA